MRATCHSGRVGRDLPNHEEHPVADDARILIVDDDALVRILLRHMLTKAGYCTPHEARGGCEALRLLDRDRYDLVILDVHLPDLSGLEVCRKIRASLQQTRVILMSGLAHHRDDVVRVGAAAFLDKPLPLAACRREKTSPQARSMID